MILCCPNWIDKKLSHKGLDSFQKDNPNLSIHSFVEGWNEIIHKNLREYLNR